MMGCLKYLLKQSWSLSPNVTLEKEKDRHQPDTDGGNSIYVDDSEYLTLLQDSNDKDKE